MYWSVTPYDRPVEATHMTVATPDGDDFVLSTGRTFSANNRIIGINPALGVYEGYDGGVQGAEDWSAEERAELADFMIALWQQFKQKA